MKSRTVFSKAISLVFVVSASRAFIPMIAEAGQSDLSAQRLEEAANDLRDFKSSGSNNDLRAAIDSVSSAVDVTTHAGKLLVLQRRNVVRAYASILGEIDDLEEAEGPQDTADPIEVCVTPPVDSNGVEWPPCTAPSEIIDPVARAKYTLELQANRVKIERWNRSFGIRMLDDRAMGSLESALKLYKSVSTPADGPQLENILLRSGITHPRQQTISAMF